MCKIDDYQEWLSHVHALKSSRHAFELAYTGFNQFVRDPCCLRRANCRQNVVNINAAKEWGMNLKFAFRRVRAKCKPARRQRQFLGLKCPAIVTSLCAPLSRKPR